MRRSPTWPRVLVIWAIRLVLVGTVVALWQWFLPRRLPRAYFAPLTDVLSQVGAWLADGSAWEASLVTMRLAATGLALGSLVGLAVALVLHRLKALAQVLEPLLSAFYATPRVVLLPSLALWLGRDASTAAIFVAINSFMPMLHGVRIALAGGRSEHEIAVRIMGGRGRHVLRFVELPRVAAAAVTSVAVAAPLALIAALIAEMLIGSRGLGYQVNLYSQSYSGTRLLATIVLAAVWGIIIDRTAAVTQKQLARRQLVGGT